jgi:hypothetical protein
MSIPLFILAPLKGRPLRRRVLPGERPARLLPFTRFGKDVAVPAAATVDGIWIYAFFFVSVPFSEFFIFSFGVWDDLTRLPSQLAVANLRRPEFICRFERGSVVAILV